MISNDVKKAFELGKKEGREETKKWIEELIDNFEYTGGDCGVVLRELKKQISGAKA